MVVGMDRRKFNLDEFDGHGVLDNIYQYAWQLNALMMTSIWNK